MEKLKITLKAARVNSGLTQKEVAEKLGKSPYTIINWENNKTSINLLDFKKLCKLYGIEEDNIFFNK